MSKFLKKLLSSTLAVAMLLSIMATGAWAEGPPAPPDGAGAPPMGQMPGDPPGDPGMAPPPADDGAAFVYTGTVKEVTPDSVGSAAAIYVDAGKRVADKEYAEEAGVQVTGTATDSEFTGTISTDTYFASGIVVENGSTYTIKDTTISATTNPKDNEPIAPGTGINAGTAIAVRDGSFVTIENADISTEGAWGSMDYVRGCVAVGWASKATGDTVVIRDSKLVNYGDTENTSNVGLFPAMPGIPLNIMKNLTVSGQGRSFVALGDSVSYLYNDYIESNGWAAICNDMAAGDGLVIYAVGTTGVTTQGGYGIYSDTNCADYLYATALVGADFGAIMSVSGILVADSYENATPEALKYFTDADAEATLAGVSTDSMIAGGRNAIMTHSTEVQTAENTGTIVLKNTALETSKEYLGTTEEEDYLAGFGAYFADTDGAAILVKSSTQNITLENVTVDSYSNTLIEAIVDCDGGGISPDQTALPTNVSIKNVTSDEPMRIVNYDYQRPMNVTISGGFVGSMDFATKEEFVEMADVWNAETMVVDYKADVAFNGGLSLTLASDAVWTVTEVSSLSSLTLEDGAVVNGTITNNPDGTVTVAPAGGEIAISGPDTVAVGQSIQLSVGAAAPAEPGMPGDPDMPAPPDGEPPMGEPPANTVTFNGENFSIELVAGEAGEAANVIQTAPGAHDVSFKVVPAEGFIIVNVSTENDVNCTKNDDGSYTIGFTMTGDTDAVVVVETAPDQAAPPPEGGEGGEGGMPDGEPPANSMTVEDKDSAVISVVYVSDGKPASDCPRTGVIFTLKAGYVITVSGGTAEVNADGTVTVTPDPGPNPVTVTVAPASAAPKAADFAGYQAYLVEFAKNTWNDDFLNIALADIAAMTEDDYSSAMIYTILTGQDGMVSPAAMTYEDWLAAQSGTPEPPADGGDMPGEPPADGGQPGGPGGPGGPIETVMPDEGAPATWEGYQEYLFNAVSSGAPDKDELRGQIAALKSWEDFDFTVSPWDQIFVEGGFIYGMALTWDEYLAVVGTDSPAPAEYVWTSSDESIATVVGDGESATVTGVAPGTVTITVTTPDGATASKDITVTAAVSFTDVTDADWFAPAVNAAAAAGIINGMGDGTFAPNNSVTRAQVAKMIVVATGTPVDPAAVPSFKDCSGEAIAWAVPYIAAAEKAGLMKGLDADTFDPNGTMTRAQLAALICQAKGLTSTEGAKSFPDVPASEWYANHVAMASAAGFVKGDDLGNYNPTKAVTRAEFAQVIYNMYLK